jgi:hypothetical protein
MGKFDNFVAWLEIIKADAGALYGSTARFLTTNVRYVPRIPIEADNNPAIPEVEGQSAPPALTAAAMGKLREGAYDRRNKSIEQQLKDNEEKLFNYIELRLSAASLAKIKEEATYDQISLDQDVIGLWGLIRRTHLTHIYGEGDPLMEVNVKEQEIRYANLKQGEKEYISIFKTRFDNQLKANRVVGIAEITESKRALDFIYMPDQKRFGKIRMGMQYAQEEHQMHTQRPWPMHTDLYRLGERRAGKRITRNRELFCICHRRIGAGHQRENSRKRQISFSWEEKRRKSHEIILSDHLLCLQRQRASRKRLQPNVAGKGVSFAEEDEEFYETAENGYGAIYVTTEIENHDIPPTDERILFPNMMSKSIAKSRYLSSRPDPS